jgi:anti-anti-sigma factor
MRPTPAHGPPQSTVDRVRLSSAGGADVCYSGVVTGAPEFSIAMRPAVGMDRWRVSVAGELDTVTAPQLLEAVTAALRLPNCRDIIVDLTGVTFADAVAVGALVQARLACRYIGGRFTVFGARAGVAEILHLTGVAESFGLPAPRGHPRAEAGTDR